MGVPGTVTVLAYALAVGLDFVSSRVLLERGHVEMNPLYSLIGPVFWLLYLVLSGGILLLLLVCSQRWWWAYLLLWIPTLVHLVCGVHNLGIM